MGKLTIKEIAKIAGVSPSAVSIVLNDKAGVSEETRKKVVEIVEKLQYTPNPNSRRLLFNKTNNLGILFMKDASPMEHFFYSELNRIILHECDTLGYNLIFASVTIKDGMVSFPNVIKSCDVDGIILYGDVDPLVINGLQRFDIPYIIVDSHKATHDTVHIRADYTEAAYTATRHLIELGHRDIAYIGGGFQAHFSSQTFSGFKRAIEENRISLPINWVQIEADDEQTAYQCMENILSYDQLPTAVFCSADIFAISAIKCIKEKGQRVPDDISVIGVDDIVLSQYIDPPLTTVRIDKEEMGRIAVDLLIRKIEKAPVESCIVSSDKLIVRGSVRSKRQGETIA